MKTPIFFSALASKGENTNIKTTTPSINVLIVRINISGSGYCKDQNYCGDVKQARIRLFAFAFKMTLKPLPLWRILPATIGRPQGIAPTIGVILTATPN
jgi:hypothetical protein